MTTGKEQPLLRPKYLVKKATEEEINRYKVGPNVHSFVHAGTHAHSFEPPAVMLATDSEDVDSPFVLMPRKDPAAYAALIYYAQCCEPRLAAEIASWLGKIAEAPPAFGTQGTKNFETTRKAALSQL